MGVPDIVGGSAAAKSFIGGWSTAAKPCDCCKSAAAILLCRAHSAFMCLSCDANVHRANKHERVWMCEVCEQAPASVTCKADAATMCSACDRDIHSANPLAKRHERLPVVPFYDSAESVVKSTAATAFLAHPVVESDNSLSDPWISSDSIPSKFPADASDMKSIELLLSDNFLNFDHLIQSDAKFRRNYSPAADSVVPVQSIKPTFPIQSHEKHFEIDFTKANISSCSNGVSSSSIDFGIVPEGNSMSDIPYPLARKLNGSSVDLSCSGGEISQASQSIALDREARVLRYREKRKNRKFEKTIRYASRKAYAETRPRIKGRFAKRTEVVGSEDDDIDRLFTADFVSDAAAYGVVPSL